MMCRFLLDQNLPSEGARPVPTVTAIVGGPTLQGVRRAYRIVLTGKSTWRKQIRPTGSTGRKSFFFGITRFAHSMRRASKQESSRRRQQQRSLFLAGEKWTAPTRRHVGRCST